MLIEITEAVIWDDEKPFYQQSQEAQALINEAMQSPVIKRTYEGCLEGKRRATLRTYQLNDTLTLDVIPVYNTLPNEPEFMGIGDLTYIINQI
jgi:hypothetical protein